MPNTSHYKIFDYWKDKIILPSGEIKLFDERDPSSDFELVVNDWGEPCCWACGRPAIKDEELLRFFNEHPDSSGSEFFKKLYDLKSLKSKLNRCHIRPNALGGADSPENLFLMCEECHHLSPDTTNVAAFFRWVYDRKQKYVLGTLNPRETFRLIDEELSRRGLPPLMKCIEVAKQPYVMSDINEFLNNSIGTHGGKVSESSMIVGITDWILHDITRSVLKV